MLRETNPPGGLIQILQESGAATPIAESAHVICCNAAAQVNSDHVREERVDLAHAFCEGCRAGLQNQAGLDLIHVSISDSAYC